MLWQLLGMRPWRIKLLRDKEANAQAIFDAGDEARWWVHDDNILWFVFIGHTSGESGQYGTLWMSEGNGTLASGEPFTTGITELLTHINRGHHPLSDVTLAYDVHEQGSDLHV